MAIGRKGLTIQNAIRVVRSRQNMINQEIVDNGGAPSLRAFEKAMRNKNMSLKIADRILWAMDYRIAVVPDGANLPDGCYYIKTREEDPRDSELKVMQSTKDLAKQYFGNIDW